MIENITYSLMLENIMIMQKKLALPLCLEFHTY